MSRIKLINRKTKKEYWVSPSDLEQMKASGLIKRFEIDENAKPVPKQQFKPLELRELKKDRVLDSDKQKEGSAEEKHRVKLSDEDKPLA
jgi:hypothetical protein